MNQPSSLGQCPTCGSANSYSIAACHQCGARLPWAEALLTTAQAARTQARVEATPIPLCCGVPLPEGAKWCPKCGRRVAASYALGGGIAMESRSDDEPYWLFNFLSCLFPIIGLILFLVLREAAPRRAAACGTWAITGFIIGMIIYTISRSN